MTQLSQKILDHYQIRKTKKQKAAFIALIQSYFPETQIQQGKFPSYKNLILGDVDNAKVILAAHYDTCARMLLPNFTAPKNPVLSILYRLVILIPVLIALFALGTFMQIPQAFVRWIIGGVFLLLLYLVVAGPTRSNIANDNTSGVITLCEFYACLAPSQKRKMAIVLFDREVNNRIGSMGFRKQYKKVMKRKLLINFDYVGDGDTIMLATSKAAREKYGQLIDDSFLPTDNKTVMLCNAENIYYPSDQMGFRESVAVAALKHKKLIGHYMDRIPTKRDTQLDRENIKLLWEGTLNFIKKL